LIHFEFSSRLIARQLDGALLWRVFDVILEKRYDLVARFWSSRNYGIEPELERVITI